MGEKERGLEGKGGGSKRCLQERMDDASAFLLLIYGDLHLS